MFLRGDFDLRKSKYSIRITRYFEVAKTYSKYLYKTMEMDGNPLKSAKNNGFMLYIYNVSERCFRPSENASIPLGLLGILRSRKSIAKAL